MRRPAAWLAMALLAAACGGVHRVVPAQGASAAATATPAAAQLVLSGAVSATVTSLRAQPPCGAQPNGYTADLRFALQGREYSLAITLADYSGPGRYPAPPGKLSIHTAGFGTGPPVLYAGTSGTVTVAADQASGTVDEDLAGDPGRVHLAGSWRC